MGTSIQYTALGALLLAIVHVCNAIPSVPVATDPILSTETVSTVVPSLLTIYSTVPGTGVPGEAQTITSTVDGQPTTITSVVGDAAASETSTIISTIYLTTTSEVVNTVGYSTVLGPDPVTSISDPATAITSSPTSTAPAETPTTTPTIAETSSTSSTSFAVVVPSTTDTPLTTTSESSTSLSSAVLFASPTTSQPSASSSTSSSLQASSSAHPSHSHGLSPAQKAGIGVGVAIGVFLLAVAAFILGLHYSHRRTAKAAAKYDGSKSSGGEAKDDFLVGRPYEHMVAQSRSPNMSVRKDYQIPTEIHSVSSSSRLYEAQNAPSSPPLPPRSHQRVNGGYSPFPPAQEDEPMYIGVPAHMSGSKRWSMKEYEK
ncbi:hypothetical protein ABEF93_008294 [Exophiala dermatitidis]